MSTIEIKVPLYIATYIHMLYQCICTSFINLTLRGQAKVEAVSKYKTIPF